MLQSHHRQAPLSFAAFRASLPRRPVVVCGLDGSAQCVELSRIASRLAAGLAGRVEYVHVLDAGRRAVALDAGSPTRRSDARAMLDSAVEASDAPGTARLIEFGDPARRIAKVAESENATLIVVGTQEDGPSGTALLGSVSGRLAADAPCPVLVVPPAIQQHVRPRTWWARTIVCGYDGSASAWRSAADAATLAAGMCGRLKLVSVGTAVAWSMEDVAARLARHLEHPPPGRDPVTPPAIDWEVRAGDPAGELERVAAAITAPLIAIGSKGDGESRDPLLGDVARQLLRTTRRPILVTPAAS